MVFEEENGDSGKFRHWCHEEILQKYQDYSLLDGCFTGLGMAPVEYPDNVGMYTQVAVFVKKQSTSQLSFVVSPNSYQRYFAQKNRANMLTYINKTSSRKGRSRLPCFYLNESEFSIESGYNIVFKQAYPFIEPYENFETESERQESIMNEVNFSRHTIRFRSIIWLDF